MASMAILIIDSHPFWQEVKPRMEKNLKVEVVQTDNGAGLEDLLTGRFFALVLASEARLAASLALVRQRCPLIPVIVVSPRPTVEGAVAAMREGARDYLALPMPFDKLQEAVQPFLVLDRAFLASGSSQGMAGGRLRPIITRDPAMLHIIKLAEAVAPTRAPVLIQGESLESELFGHEKGAFTGAIMRKLGKFELAQNGTLLLDEISEMHPHLQAKLLRVLQENEIDRVGGRHPIPINVRVVATTNQNLPELIQKGAFREDLYYRLQVITLELPPLRARRGDIPLLAEYFLRQFSRLFDKGELHFTPAALRALEAAPWPGNVRQLENAVARGVLLAQGSSLHPRDLLGALPPEAGSVPAPPIQPGKPLTLREMEQFMIFQALQHFWVSASAPCATSCMSIVKQLWSRTASAPRWPDFCLNHWMKTDGGAYRGRKLSVWEARQAAD
ncbi:MAG: sigma-54-dependent Fis family transcriptional regulator [Deltaproteobacteria bacterium]|nr:sigma-54-dependent Fis family transcriptional regulator [Deltaproteobacteria bacterium]